MREFACPHNKTVVILQRCPVTECPFHVGRVGAFFRMESNTGCVFYDTNLMSNDTPSRTQISALSRDPTRTVAPSSIRSMYTDMLNNARTMHALTHDVVQHTHCRCCGYPGRPACVSAAACAERLEWVTGVLVNVFKMIKPTVNSRAIVWQRLVARELYLDPAHTKAGYDLCRAQDVAAPQ